jgi:hypothetical protein
VSLRTTHALLLLGHVNSRFVLMYVSLKKWIPGLNHGMYVLHRSIQFLEY